MVRICGGLGALLFAWAAALQANDPDPLRWIALYLVAAALCAVAPYRALPLALPLGLGALAAIWAATLVPTVLAESAWTGTEVEREVGGLLVVALAAFTWTWIGRERKSRSD